MWGVVPGCALGMVVLVLFIVVCEWRLVFGCVVILICWLAVWLEFELLLVWMDFVWVFRLVLWDWWYCCICC